MIFHCVKPSNEVQFLLIKLYVATQVWKLFIILSSIFHLFQRNLFIIFLKLNLFLHFQEVLLLYSLFFFFFLPSFILLEVWELRGFILNLFFNLNFIKFLLHDFFLFVEENKLFHSLKVLFCINCGDFLLYFLCFNFYSCVKVLSLYCKSLEFSF